MIAQIAQALQSFFSGVKAVKVQRQLGTASNNSLYDATQHNGTRRNIPRNVWDSYRTLNRFTRLEALSLARWAYENEGFTRGAVDAIAMYATSDLIPIPLHDDDDVVQERQDFFIQASKVMNIAGGTLAEDLDLISRAIDVDGGIGALLLSSDTGFPQYQLFQAHRIATGTGGVDGTEVSFSAIDPSGNNVTVTGKIYDGAIINDYGRVVGWRLLTDEYGAFQDVPAWNFIYIGERTRTDQYQCITNLIHGLTNIQDAKEIVDIEKRGVKSSISPALVLYSDNPEEDVIGGGAVPTYDPKSPTGSTNPNDPNYVTPPTLITQENIDGGMIIRRKTGEKIESHKSAKPTPGIKDFNEVLLRPVSLGLGLPVSFVWNPEALGGANCRLAVSMASRRFEKRKKLLVDQFLNRLYFWVISKGLKMGALLNQDAPWRVRWQGGQKITVDAQRDANANRSDIWAGIRTLEEDAAERGQDWRQIQIQKGKEASHRAKIAAQNKVDPNLVFCNSANPTPPAPGAPGGPPAPADPETPAETSDDNV